ncbi:MAG: hypothetical protein ACW99G_10465 [Candidatus Thorarchaeota archaeon]
MAKDFYVAIRQLGEELIMLYEPGSICEICNNKEELHKSCKICNANVCVSCWALDDEICINCREAKCQICGEYLSSRACNNCGKLVCEDHGLRINEVTLCDSCRKSDE